MFPFQFAYLNYSLKVYKLASQSSLLFFKLEFKMEKVTKISHENGAANNKNNNILTTFFCTFLP